MKTFGHFIAGKWVKSDSRKTFESTNPADPKEVLGKFQLGAEKDVQKAITAAENAFIKWREVPAPKRGELILKAAQLLKREKERLAKLMVKEMGKVLKEARGDVQEAIDIAEYMAGEGRRLFGHTTPSELRDKFAMTIRIPLGVCGLITPWNFPLAIPAWKIFPALICGNTVILKPSSDTPLMALEFMKILDKAGFPKGTVNCVTGSGSVAGKELIENKRVKAISFTGSKETGEFIAGNAGIKKIGLELGGKNPIIVMDDADLNLALEGVIWGAFGTTGQRCTAASRVIIHEKVKKQFEEMLVSKAKKLRLGSGLKESTDVGPLINEAAVKKSEYYCGIGVKEKAKLLIGGKRARMNGCFFEPTIFTDVKPGMRIAQEEIFGPVVSLISVKNINEAIKVANNIEYGLSSSIYTNNVRNAFLAMQKINAGITYVNSSTIGSEVHLPFGGTKGTGNGTREAGIEGINEFSETKTLYIDYSGKLQKAQIDEVKVD